MGLVGSNQGCLIWGSCGSVSLAPQDLPNPDVRWEGQGRDHQHIVLGYLASSLQYATLWKIHRNHRNLRSDTAVDNHQALVFQTMRLLNMLQSDRLNSSLYLKPAHHVLSSKTVSFPRCKFRHHPKASDANGLHGAGYPKIAGDNIPGSCGSKVPGWVFGFLVLKELTKSHRNIHTCFPSQKDVPQLKMCVFLSSRKIYQSSAIRQICSGSLLSNNHWASCSSNGKNWSNWIIFQIFPEEGSHI